MRNYISELIPSLCIGVSLFLMSIPFMVFDFLKNEYFFNFLKSLLPSIVQFIVFGLLYFIIVLMFTLINRGLRKWKPSKMFVASNRFSNWVLKNLSKPVNGFYQACTGILFCGVFVGLAGHLEPVHTMLVCFSAFAFSLMPLGVKRLCTISE